MEEIKREHRLRLLVLHSMIFHIPVFPNQASTLLTWVQHDMLLAIRQSLREGKRELSQWYKDALEQEDLQEGVQITDRVSAQVIRKETPEDQFQNSLPPVPKPAVFDSLEWVKG